MGALNPSSSPIGVFDSGVGGLSVLREIRARLPAEDLVYIADSAHVPYGNKTPEFILERSRALARFLAARGCKALVIACNTATAAAAQTLRDEWAMPVVAMEPAVKPAVAATKSGVVGVLATVGTLRSARFAGLLETSGAGVRIETQAAPGLVECVEEGRTDAPETAALVASFVAPLVERGADVIVLGCTHYPFLRSVIANAAGPGVALIDTGAAVARQLERRLEAAGLRRTDGTGTETFFTTGDAAAAVPVFSRLWGSPATVERLPAEFC